MLYINKTQSRFSLFFQTLTFAQQLKMAPQDLSVRHPLEEFVLVEGTQLATWNVDAAHLHLFNVEFFHHPYCPVDHLIRGPLHWVCHSHTVLLL